MCGVITVCSFVVLALLGSEDLVDCLWEKDRYIHVLVDSYKSQFVYSMILVAYIFFLIFITVAFVGLLWACGSATARLSVRLEEKRATPLAGSCSLKAMQVWMHLYHCFGSLLSPFYFRTESVHVHICSHVVCMGIFECTVCVA